MQLGVLLTDSDRNADFNLLKKNEVSFAIIRCGYSKNHSKECIFDIDFFKLLNEALKANLKVGLYFESHAFIAEEIIYEAQWFNNVLKEYKALPLHAWFEFTDADLYKMKNDFQFSRKNCTNLCQLAFNEINYPCGLYAAHNWLLYYIDWKTLNIPLNCLHTLSTYGPEYLNTYWKNLPKYTIFPVEMWNYLTGNEIANGYYHMLISYINF